MQISDFGFKKVLIPVNFSNGSTAEYRLLVDDDDRIHYYQVHWKIVFLEQVTTNSHKESKKSNKAYLFRLNLFEYLDIKHYYSNQHKKSRIKLNKDQIQKLNIFFDENWVYQTFQNIIYVITGSNPSGEGKPTSANVKWNKKSIGFLLQCLNISTQHNLCTIDSYVDEFKSLKLFYTFDEWIKSNRILIDNLNKFNSYTERFQWKKDCKKLKNIFSKYMELKEKIDCQVTQERNRFEKQAKERYPNIYDFWKNDVKTKPNYAHIKPVNIIRKNCDGENFNSLKQISDINNCLPLTFDMHKYYDDGCFYWKTNGKIEINHAKKYELPENLAYFSTIPKERLIHIIKYIEDYEKIIEY